MPFKIRKILQLVQRERQMCQSLWPLLLSNRYQLKNHQTGNVDLVIPLMSVAPMQYSGGKRKYVLFCVYMEIASLLNVFEKIISEIVLALESEKTDCSGFSWIVSIMVNGFSKCQRSCFIDLGSQRGEQTHLVGILLTAGTSPCIFKPNQE